MQWQNLVRQKAWKSTATMDLQFLPDMKGGAREVGGIGARGGRAGGCCGGSPESTTMAPPPSASGSASMLISPLPNWSECLVARWDSRADLTLKRAGQNGQRLLMTCWCARNCPFLSLARVFWVVIQCGRENSRSFKLQCLNSLDAYTYRWFFLPNLSKTAML